MWSHDCWRWFAKREHEAVFAFYAPAIEWDATAWAVDCGGEQRDRQILEQVSVRTPPGKLADSGMMPA